MKFHMCYLSVFVIGLVSRDYADAADSGIYTNCTDYKRQVVPHGERYRPMGVDACTSCSCEYGMPQMCQAKLCSAPKGCANPLPIDDTCCEFECPDGGDGGNRRVPSSNGTSVEPTNDLFSTTNLGLRLVASTVTSFLILALLLFMIHRLRQRRLLLMLRRLDMNGSHLSSAPFGVRRYSFDDDGSVGYLTGQDQVDFAPYDEPPPPYTFWKPPESYFPQEEAPPPYEASNNNNNSCNNAVNNAIHQTLPIANVTPIIPPNPIPVQCITPVSYTPPVPIYANTTLNNGTIPCITQVPLRTNNFRMNNLDEVRDSDVQRHSVPIQDLNVVGSLSSLNSSQSELNDSNAEPAAGSALAIRSDAVYDEYPAGMLPPLSPTGSGGSTPGAPCPADVVGPCPAAISTGTYSVRRPKIPDVLRGSPFKCHSCSDVAGCWHQKKPHDAGKRRSLQPGIHFCPDPTAWSETSSSSSPTYERTTGTLSPTSSDSSSVDYNFGASHNLPRRTHSDTQFGGHQGGATGTSSSSLDRTLRSLRNKMAPKKKPGKLRQLLGGAETSKKEKRDLVPEPPDEVGAPPGEANVRLCPPSQRPGWRTPRILYVSDGDISLRSLLRPQDGPGEKGSTPARPMILNLDKKSRPHSYDFGDLQAGPVGATYPIKEEATPASGDATRSDNPPSLPTNTADCCCSLSSDRLGSSWDSFACTCSSRASFGSSSGPGSPSSATAEPSSSTDEAAPRTREVARSASVCSETGERKHRMGRQAEAPPAEEQPAPLSPVDESSPQEPSEAAGAEAGPPPPTLAVANRIRVTIGAWKGNHESYI